MATSGIGTQSLFGFQSAECYEPRHTQKYTLILLTGDVCELIELIFERYASVVFRPSLCCDLMTSCDRLGIFRAYYKVRVLQYLFFHDSTKLRWFRGILGPLCRLETNRRSGQQILRCEMNSLASRGQSFGFYSFVKIATF